MVGVSRRHHPNIRTFSMWRFHPEQCIGSQFDMKTLFPYLAQPSRNPSWIDSLLERSSLNEKKYFSHRRFFRTEKWHGKELVCWKKHVRNLFWGNGTENRARRVSSRQLYSLLWTEHHFFIFSQKRKVKQNSSTVFIDFYVRCFHGGADICWRDHISAQISADICKYLQISADICHTHYA